MRRPLALLAALLAPCAAAIPTGGCNNQAGPSDAGPDATIIPGGDSGNEDAESDGSGVLTSTMRLANMSPDLGPVDFCWRVTGSTSFAGPVLATPLDAGPPASGTDASDASADADASTDASATEDASEDAMQDAVPEGASEDAIADAADDALDAEAPSADASEDAADTGEPPGEAGGIPLQVSFGAMTAFVQLPVIGTLDLALVPPGQLSCNAPAFIGRVTLDPDKPATVAIMGLLGADAGSASALTMRSFTDEPASAGAASVRVVHAALGWPGGDGPAPPLAVQAGNALLVAQVDPADVPGPSTSPPVDALGYATAPAFDAPAPIELFTLDDASPRTWSTPFFPLGLLPGTTTTAFIVTLAQGALGIAWCGSAQSVELPGTCVMQAAK